MTDLAVHRRAESRRGLRIRRTVAAVIVLVALVVAADYAAAAA